MKLRHLWLAAATAAVVSLLSVPFIGRASQNGLALPTTGVFSGLTEQNNINNALDSLLTCSSGSAAPTNQLGGVPKEGQCWLDTTSTSSKVLKRYTGSAWVVEAVIDVTNGIWTPPIGGGLWGASIAGAATVDVGSVPQSAVVVTGGGASITSFGSSAAVGTIHFILFNGANTLVNSANIFLPDSANITTAANDVVVAAYRGSGSWFVLQYARGSIPSKASPTTSDFVLIQDAAASNTPKKSLLSALLALTGVNSINGNTGAFTTSHGVINSTNDLRFDIGSIPNYLSGLTLSTAGGSATFSIAAGAAADSTNADLMKIAAFSKTTSGWAVGSGNGALDTGSIANGTWYHAFVIKRPDTGVVDGCISASTTGCGAGVGNIPAAYTISRRIGSMKTNGSAQWTKFIQFGDEFLWDVAVQDLTAATGSASTLQTLTVAPGVQVEALMHVFLNISASGTMDTKIWSPDQGTAPNLSSVHGQTSQTNNAQIRVRTNTSAQIRHAETSTNGNVTIETQGWTDLRGKI
jgi:hypothetical protein